MGAMASQSTGVSIIYSIVCFRRIPKKKQSSASLAFVRGIQRWPLNSAHKGKVTRKMFPFDDISMIMRFTWTTHISPSRPTYHEYSGEKLPYLFLWNILQTFPVMTISGHQATCPRRPPFLRMRYWFSTNTHRSHIDIVRLILTIVVAAAKIHQKTIVVWDIEAEMNEWI